MQALIEYVATAPEALLDGPGDPRVGMAGSSYGGGIQFATAAIDQRVDAIVPDIAWHSLVTSLAKEGAFKAGWMLGVCASGEILGLSDGVIEGLGGPAGVQLGSTALGCERCAWRERARVAVGDEPPMAGRPRSRRARRRDPRADADHPGNRRHALRVG